MSGLMKHILLHHYMVCIIKPPEKLSTLCNNAQMN
jgi:hypothetical protein